MASPLQVLVTRARHQGSALAERLRDLGLDPVLIPAIEIAAPSSFDSLDLALDQVKAFDWVVFSSANAVPVFIERLTGRAVPENIKLAAIGPSTARALEAHGLSVRLVPLQAVAESFAEALLPHVRQMHGRAARFLLVRAEEGRDLLPDILREAGAEVTISPAYRTVVPQESVDLVRELLRDHGSNLRAVTFTSSSAVRNLFALCEAAQVDLPAGTLRVSIGPVTSATMRGLGYPPDAEAAVATVESLAETVANALGAEKMSLPADA